MQSELEVIRSLKSSPTPEYSYPIQFPTVFFKASFPEFHFTPSNCAIAMYAAALNATSSLFIDHLSSSSDAVVTRLSPKNLGVVAVFDGIGGCGVIGQESAQYAAHTLNNLIPAKQKLKFLTNSQAEECLRSNYVVPLISAAFSLNNQHPVSGLSDGEISERGVASTMTLCLLTKTITGSTRLSIANLGDSAVRLIRNGKMVRLHSEDTGLGSLISFFPAKVQQDILKIADQYESKNDFIERIDNNPKLRKSIFNLAEILKACQQSKIFQDALESDSDQDLPRHNKLITDWIKSIYGIKINFPTKEILIDSLLKPSTEVELLERFITVFRLANSYLKTSLKTPISQVTYKSHHLKKGDILVIASDGVWDQLSEQTLVEITNKNANPTDQAMEISAAAYNSKGYPLGRGKYDDISVVVLNI